MLFSQTAAKSGKYTVKYYKYPKVCGGEDDYACEIDYAYANIIVYLVAHRVWMDDDMSKSVLYWNTFEGFCTKELINESKKISEKYNKNEILKQFFDLQKDIGLFHFTEIFKPEYKKNSQILNSQLENLEMPISQNVCNEGVLLAVKDKNNAWCGPAIPIVKIKD